MKLIVGLGNPGITYAQTRHNAGFMLVDKLAALLKADKEKKQGNALIRTAVAGSVKLLLMKPQAYMNLSGDPIWELLNFYKGGVEDFIVIHDDMDLPLGRIRFKNNGGSGGHKGLKSITSRLGSDEYDRLKLGISRPPERMPVEAYVLQPFSMEERAVLDKALERSAEGLLYWIEEGCEWAMNKYNADPAERAGESVHGDEKEDDGRRSVMDRKKDGRDDA